MGSRDAFIYYVCSPLSRGAMMEERDREAVSNTRDHVRLPVDVHAARDREDPRRRGLDVRDGFGEGALSLPLILGTGAVDGDEAVMRGRDDARERVGLLTFHLQVVMHGVQLREEQRRVRAGLRRVLCVDKSRVSLRPSSIA